MEECNTINYIIGNCNTCRFFMIHNSEQGGSTSKLIIYNISKRPIITYMKNILSYLSLRIIKRKEKIMCGKIGKRNFSLPGQH